MCLKSKPSKTILTIAAKHDVQISNFFRIKPQISLKVKSKISFPVGGVVVENANDSI